MLLIVAFLGPFIVASDCKSEDEMGQPTVAVVFGPIGSYAEFSSATLREVQRDGVFYYRVEIYDKEAVVSAMEVSRSLDYVEGKPSEQRGIFTVDHIGISGASYAIHYKGTIGSTAIDGKIEGPASAVIDGDSISNSRITAIIRNHLVCMARFSLVKCFEIDTVRE